NKPRRGKSKSKSGKTRSSRREPASRDPDEADKDGKDKKGKDKKEKKKKNREPSQLERIAIRPLMLMRKARLSYAETFRTVVPGFTPRSRLLGMSEGFEAPGWAFIAGLQPDISPGGWLDEAADRGWITDNVFQNQQVVQNYTQSFDAKFTIEPFKDFRIDVDANRSFTQNHTEFFKDTTFDNNSDIVHAVPRDVGSYSSSWFSMQTLFENDIFELFKRFENNRQVISDRLAGVVDPTLGQHELDPQYRQGFGRYQQDVLIPAFLSAYNKKDVNTIAVSDDYANSILFDIRRTLPRPNWRLSYNGLSKLPGLKDIFSSVSINHGYRSTMTVNSFN
ncbi:MAG: cell surface protein SprA, partial [Bacteroidota bacterium]